MECTYDAMRRDPVVLDTVENGLLEEQGGICAYTGHRIAIAPTSGPSGSARKVDFHIEHLVSQRCCYYGQDADYANMVACWPRPNCGFEPAYGARKKGDWPSAAESYLFVSPLRSDCSSRFTFDRLGRISAAMMGDRAAEKTIKKLGLDHKTLVALRREAIQGALNPLSRPSTLEEKRKLLARMDRTTEALDKGGAVERMPFCFAIEAVLRREIDTLGKISKQA